MEEAKSELATLDEIFGSEPAATAAEHCDRVAKYLHYTQIHGIGNVFDFDKGSDLKQVNNVVLDLSSCGLSLPSREYYTEENFQAKRDLFAAHLGKIGVRQHTSTHMVLEYDHTV